jgi:hypothetical protein
LLNETVDSATLTNSQRGHLAELIFMRKAAGLGFSVSKPWGESERYDVIVRVGANLWRVQVKSVLAASPSRHDYCLRIAGGTARGRAPYSVSEIDFLAAYLFAKSLWYVFPVSLIAGRRRLWLTPGSKRSRFEQYREAWTLMKTHLPCPAAESTLGRKNQELHANRYACAQEILRSLIVELSVTQTAGGPLLAEAETKRSETFP